MGQTPVRRRPIIQFEPTAQRESGCQAHRRWICLKKASEGKKKFIYFSEDGKPNVELLPCPRLVEARGEWVADCRIPKDNSLGKAEVILAGETKRYSLTFLSDANVVCR